MNKKLLPQINYNIMFFIIAISAVAIPLLNLFYAFAIGKYGSDYPAHNLFALSLFNNSLTPELINEINDLKHINSYLLYHFTVKVVQIFATDNYDISSAIVSVYACIATTLVVRKILRKFVDVKSVSVSYIVDIISITSIFFTGLSGFFTGGVVYASVGSPNVWHNPTTIFVKPIMLLAFYFFIDILAQLKSGKKDILKLVIFSVLLVLSAFAKPSFAIVLVPAMGIFIAIYIIKDFKVRLLNVGLPMLLAVVPLIVILLWQYIYVSDNSSSIETVLCFAPGFGRDPSTPQEPLFIIGAILSLFTLIIYCFVVVGYKNLKNEDTYLISIIAALIGWAQAYFLRQEGATAGDFFWGYMLAIHLASVMSLAVLLKYAKSSKLYLGLGIYAVQVIQGIIYFIEIAYMGKSYFS